ncbi:C6 transcription factor [Aspergillus steynii IBT 23096]|uniref:C6 transcription factor n=1 Tax=Aspergillus steynii IBT 23096 TaxID=1392250 RepID=A0A2I2G597_9EURO|nr:C6 transcription factor [Aspergillus steynii IBT 23096]PLB48051.1 C6 transcription factor [Aspergillus steynii IBT 23096]
MNPEDQDKHLPTLAPGPRGPVLHPGAPCSGRPPPCKACQNTEAECVFDETLDLRRKVAAKRTLGELEYCRGLLNSLLKSLRSPDEEKVQFILKTIRQTPSLNDVATAVDAPTVDMIDATSDNVKGGNNAEDVAPHHGVYAGVSRVTLERLCDSPVFRVPAKPWTRVTEDNDLVSHLISLYFTWDHPLSQLIDQRMFIEHMRKGDTNSAFCSPLLVNSVLAMGSAYSDFPELFSCPGDLSSKGKHFFTEAERLWEAEDGHASLSNIQAIAIMSCVLSFQAKKTSWLMLRQAVQLAQDIGMFQTPRSGHQEWKKTHMEVQYAGVITAWGIFALNSQVSLESGKTANLARPRFKPFTKNKLDDELDWKPYPRMNQADDAAKPAFLASVMVHTTDLSEIVADIQDLLYEKALEFRMEDVWVAANNLYTRLATWLERLPDVLQVDEDQIPHILYLHIKCYYTTIYLFGFFLEHEGGRVLQPAQIEQARLARLQSANLIAQSLRIHHEAYGLRHVPRQMLGPTNQSALVLLIALEDEELKESFIELCRFLVAFSKRFSQAQVMIHNIEKRAEQLRIPLPPEAIAVLDHKGLESSQWL